MSGCAHALWWYIFLNNSVNVTATGCVNKFLFFNIFAFLFSQTFLCLISTSVSLNLKSSILFDVPASLLFFGSCYFSIILILLILIIVYNICFTLWEKLIIFLIQETWLTTNQIYTNIFYQFVQKLLTRRRKTRKATQSLLRLCTHEHSVSFSSSLNECFVWLEWKYRFQDKFDWHLLGQKIYLKRI